MKQMKRAAPWRPGAALLLVPWLTHTAVAQTAPQDPGVRPSSRSSGVLTPPAQVDPGMTRPVPDMPAQSTPVIHPRQLHGTRHGTVRIVPK